MSETLAAPETAGDTPDAVPEPLTLTPHLALGRVIMLINPHSGGVGPDAPAQAEDILKEYGLEATVVTLEGDRFDQQVDAAFAAKPDVLLVLAGDGTAGTIATRAGAKGPLVAPLPGGTMNMLPKALYGTGDWKAALRTALSQGAEVPVSGGEVEGHVFYCAAILGSPALWAPAREAVRDGDFKLAWTYARRALKRSFTGRMRYALDGGPSRRVEAMVFISPMISRAMDEPVGLEAAAMSTHGAAEAIRLAAHAVFDDWRKDAAVRTNPTKRAVIRARSRIPAVIDGEPTLLGQEATVIFRPRAFRALAPLPREDGT